MDKSFELLETLLWKPDSGFRLSQEHTERLSKTAAHFSYPFDEKEFAKLLKSVTGTEALVVRILVTNTGEIRSETKAFQETPTGVPSLLAIDTQPVDKADEFLYHKTTNRTVYAEAKARHPHSDDVILWNNDGEITETTKANIVLKTNGVYLTPTLSCGLLAGTFRARLLRYGSIEEAELTLEQLQQADQMYLINSVRGWIKAELLPPGT